MFSHHADACRTGACLGVHLTACISWERRLCGQGWASSRERPNACWSVAGASPGRATFLRNCRGCMFLCSEKSNPCLEKRFFFSIFPSLADVITVAMERKWALCVTLLAKSTLTWGCPANNLPDSSSFISLALLKMVRTNSTKQTCLCQNGFATENSCEGIPRPFLQLRAQRMKCC